jgi:ketosteroid isomerase-like protein
MSSATIATPVSRAQATKDEADILALLETRRQAHHDKDGAVIAALYATDAAYFSLAPPLSHLGVNREEKQAWLDSWETPVEIESRDFHLTVSGDYAFGHGFLRLSGTKKGAEGKVDFWMRQTVHFERQGGAWRIVHDHASVPFYMDGTLRPAFDLRP